MKRIITILIVLISLPLYAKKQKAGDDNSIAIPPARATYTPYTAEEPAPQQPQAPEQREATQVDAPVVTEPIQPEFNVPAEFDATSFDYVAPDDEPLFQAPDTAEEPLAQTNAPQESPAVATQEKTPDGNSQEKTQVPVASKDEPVPQPEPYKSVYLLDYLELDSEDDKVPESAFNPNAGRYQFIEHADAKDADGRTLLMKAARNGNISMLENLIYSEANINATDSDGWTALMFAARFSNNPKAITLLLNAGANPQAENNYGITALLLAAGFSQNTQVVATLLEKRSIAEKEVLAAFIYAVTNEARADILQLFIEKGIAINAPYEGKTPLMYAAETNKSTVTIGWLLEHGARTRYKTTAGQTAYDFARANKRLPKDKIYWSLNTNGAAR